MLSTASSESTARVVSTSRSWRWKMPGTKPSEMPSMRWSPTSPHRMVEDSEGSMAKSLTSRVDLPEGLPDPDQGPPGPDAHDQGVGHDALGELARRISGPSQILFSSTFHSLSNCAGQK